MCSAATVLSAMARQEEAAPSVGTSVETEEHSNREEEPCSPAPNTLIHPEAGLKTSDFYKTKNIPERFEHPDWFEGYNTKQHNPFYQTSASIHGSKPPSVHTMPTQFHGRNMKFSKSLGKFGMYRNHSLNTGKD